MNAVTSDTQVVGVSPRLEPDRFAEILVDADSPAAQDAFDLYAITVAHGIEPAFFLAFFKHESQFGKVGVCADYGTHSPGNTRTSRTGVSTFVDVPGKGQYVKYSTWASGADDACYRLTDPTFVYAQKGAVTIGEILPIWAPASDNNSPQIYIQSVVSSMSQWLNENESEGSNNSTMEIIDLSANTPASVYTSRGFPVSELILHDTSGSGDFNNKSPAELQALLNATIRWFQGPGGVSIHYLIGPEALGGKIYRLCKEQYAAYHAVGNKGSVDGVSKDNRISIGIERFGQPNEAVGPNQRAAMLWLVVDICNRYGLSANQVISHMSIQADRRDGGVLLEAARQAVINGGLNHVNINQNQGPKLPDPAPATPAVTRLNNRTIGGGFKAFYDKLAAVSPNFELLVLGLPLTNEFDCDLNGNGKPNTVQLFERGALLYEQANASPWDIHLTTVRQLELILAAAKTKTLIV